MNLRKGLQGWLVLWLLLACACAQAHLMAAQKGTLNLQGDGAYLVVSLPISAFADVDENKDASWSESELDRHAQRIRRQLAEQIELKDPRGVRIQQGLTLVPTPMDDRHDAPFTQLIVMVRFGLSESVLPHSTHPVSGLVLRIGLFGSKPEERELTIAVTQGEHRHRLVLRPGHEAQALFPSPSRIWGDAFALGAAHILTGWDHLLFLAVVLLAGGSLRQVLLVLSAFTVGHALTVLWASQGQAIFNPVAIEACIAATIVLMAALEWWLRSRARSMPMAIRLTLVFACALIHGLGLASGLMGMEPDPSRRMWSLLGFNMGIEMTQCTIALGLMVAAWWVTRRISALHVERIRNTLTAMAMATGAYWFVERLT
jgi:hypothetical protein